MKKRLTVLLMFLTISLLCSSVLGMTSCGLFEDEFEILPYTSTDATGKTEECCAIIKWNKPGSTLEIPEKIDGYLVGKISSNAFSNQSQLTKVVLPDTIYSIPSGAFSGCTNLKSIRMSTALYEIGSNAFEGCSKLIQTENGISYVDKWVVDCDTSITSCNFRPSTIGIAKGAFADCLELMQITIPSHILYACGASFRDCNNLEEIYVDANNVNLTSIDGILYDKSTQCIMRVPPARTKPVVFSDNLKQINSEAFNWCRKLETIIVPDGVDYIGDYAFNGCLGLREVVIPDSVTMWGSNLFGCGFASSNDNTLIAIAGEAKWVGNDEPILSDMCTNIEKITCPMNTLLYLPKGELSNLREIIITSGDRVVTEDNFSSGLWLSSVWGFSKYSKLEKITLPNTLTSIENYDFANCSNLKEITIPDSVTSIGDSAFSNCSSLTSITIPDSVTSIGNNAFEDCSSLTSITIPEGVTSIGDFVFSNCSSLISITISDSVTSIGSLAFYVCTNLTDIHFGGTTEQWNAITINSSWDIETGDYTIHCTDGDIPKS